VDVRAHLQTLIKLVPDKAQLQRFFPGKAWWVVNKHNEKSKKRFPNAFSLVDQVDCSAKDFDAVYWKRSLVDSLQSQHPFLRCEISSNIPVVTILDSDENGKPMPIPRGAPDASAIISNTAATTVLKRQVLSSLSVPAVVTSTPTITTRRGTKRSVSSAVTPLALTMGDDVDGNGKRVRQDKTDSQVDINAI
jgi:hypothetical protein